MYLFKNKNELEYLLKEIELCINLGPELSCSERAIIEEKLLNIQKMLP